MDWGLVEASSHKAKALESFTPEGQEVTLGRKEKPNRGKIPSPSSAADLLCGPHQDCPSLDLRLLLHMLPPQRAQGDGATLTPMK